MGRSTDALTQLAACLPIAQASVWDAASSELASGTSVLALVAALVVLLLAAALPQGERRLLREPVAGLCVYVLLIAIRISLPAEFALSHVVHCLARFVVLCTIGRSLFLLVVRSDVGRRLVQPLPRIVLDVVQGVVYGLALLLTLQAAGVEPASLFTGSALVTAAIGLSMRDTLGNLFAGLAIQAQRPFDVGDWIQFDEHPQHVGKVIEVNWRATKVLTLDDVEVIVPNATLSQAPIRNFTKPETHSRRSVFVTAPYRVPTRRVQRILLHAVCDAWGVLPQPAPTVVTHDFGESGVVYWVRYFTADFDNRDRVDGGVRDRIWYALNHNGITIPFPQRQVQVWERNREVEEHEAAERLSERQEALRCVDCLQRLPDAAIDRLAATAERRFYAEDELIIRQGDPGEELFIIICGEVGVTIAGDDGNPIELGSLRVHQFFGEMSCMTGQPRTATVAVTEDCEVLVVSKADLAPILAESPELALHISDTLATRQTELERRSSARPDVPRPHFVDRRRELLVRIRRFFSL